jgi:hypothetical protein
LIYLKLARAGLAMQIVTHLRISDIRRTSYRLVRRSVSPLTGPVIPSFVSSGRRGELFSARHFACMAHRQGLSNFLATISDA